jgi:c-di-GMP-binding flagellar brake protein YcgR
LSWARCDFVEEHSVAALAIMNPSFTQTRAEERRRHQRVKLRLPGQFMREDRQEFNCVTIDISPGGIAFSSENQGGVGEKISSHGWRTVRNWECRKTAGTSASRRACRIRP